MPSNIQNEAMNQSNHGNNNVMQKAIDDFCSAILLASQKINKSLDHEQNSFYKLLTQFENNIHAVFSRIENQDFSISLENSGIKNSEQQFDEQQNFNKLLSDQNAAFGEFLIALQLIASKLEPENIYEQIADYRNTATKLDVDVSDVQFNRFMGQYDNVDKEHADQNLETFNNIYKKRGDKKAFEQDELIVALSKVEGNKDLIKNLQNTTNLKDFILLLTQAGAVAKAAKDPNALKAINTAVHGDKNSYAQMTNENTKPLTEAQKQQAQTTEGTYTNNPAQRSYQKSIAGQEADKGITQSPDAHVNLQQQRFLSQTQTQSKTDRAKADDMNFVAHKMENNPAMTAMIMAAMEYKKQLESLTGSTEGASGSISNFGGSFKNLSEVLGKGEGKIGSFFGAINKFVEGAGKLLGKGSVPGAVAMASVEATKAAVIGWYGAKRVFGSEDGIAPKLSAEERKEKLSKATDELSSEKNQATIKYLREKQGITVQYNEHMLRFEAMKDGKMIANLGEKLKDLSNNVSALIDPKNQEKIKQIESGSFGGKVQINEQTGQIGLFKKGKFVGNVDLNSSAYSTLSFLDSSLRATNREIDQEEQINKHNQQSADLSSKLNRLNQQAAGKDIPVPPSATTKDKPVASPSNVKDVPASVPNISNAKPAFPSVDPKILADQIIVSALLDTQIKVDKKLVSVTHNQEVQKSTSSTTNNVQHSHTQNNKQLPNKRPTTAHDVQMAKEATHIENSNNSYKYDVKITVNPPSGDPIQIANQVCEQLKRHTCGNDMGYSKGATSRQIANH